MSASKNSFPSSDPELWRLPKVKQVTGFKTSWLYHLIAKKQFPKQVRMGPHSRRVAWNAAEVREWVQARIDGRFEQLMQVKRIHAGRKPNEPKKTVGTAAPKWRLFGS
jgi:prophage regulatory protein